MSSGTNHHSHNDGDDSNDAQVISLVTHELKTPVAAIRGFLQLLEASGPLAPDQRKWLGRTEESLDRMEQLIASLLNWSRLQAGSPLQLTVVDMKAVIAEAARQFEQTAAQRGIEIVLDLGEDDASVPIDDRLLSYVMTNLIGNAIKFNRDGGTVSVLLSMKGTVLRVDVTDTGLGIEPKDQPRVFDRFFRASHKRAGRRIEGSGLGLAISKSVVELHGGRIWVESVPGEGSTFSFELPMEASDGDAPRDTVRGFSFMDGGRSGEVSDDVDDQMQERPENPERDSRRDQP